MSSRLEGPSSWSRSYSSGSLGSEGASMSATTRSAEARTSAPMACVQGTRLTCTSISSNT